MSCCVWFNFSGDIKHGATTTAAHSKRIFEMLKIENFFLVILLPYGIIYMVVLINTEVPLHYIYCLFFSHSYDIIIDRSVRALRYGIELVDSLNAKYQKNLSVLMK